MPPTVVVLTALPVEFQAVRRLLSDVQVTPAQGTLFDVGRVPGLPWRVALAEIGEGNSGAAAHTVRAVARFEPAAVFFVGVAGSLRDDIALGDVVVASKIYLHHGGKEGADGFHARPRAWEPRHDVEQWVRRVVREDPSVHFKPLVAGDVVLNSRTSRLAGLIDRVYNDAVAVDMESAGMAQAAHLSDTPVLAVRGISDFADGGKAVADAEGRQQVAARNAAAVAVRVLRALPVPRTRPEHPEPPRAPDVVVASPPEAGSRDAEWHGGAVVAVDGEKCLLHDGPGDLLAETASPDRTVLRRQALAHVLPGPGRASRFVWLRQVVVSYDGPVARAALRALSDEYDLLRRMGRGRDVVHHGRRDDTATLALAWPLSRRSGTPCETLGALLGDGTGGSVPLDAWRSHRVLRGLAASCGALGRLHARGSAHRALQPAALVVDDDGRLLLRDLGLAATPFVPGEAPGPYQAPEQGLRRSRAGAVGAATDVYRLGALVHHLLTGIPPVPGMPSALRRLPSPLPAVEVVEDSLAPDPHDRPDLRGLTTALRTLGDSLASLALKEQ